MRQGLKIIVTSGPPRQGPHKWGGHLDGGGGGGGDGERGGDSNSKLK